MVSVQCLLTYEQKKTRRKRKPRYPKGYDPSKPNGGLPPPDPERWLPKWQRSDAKKKQKRRRDRQVRAVRVMLVYVCPGEGCWSGPTLCVCVCACARGVLVRSHSMCAFCVCSKVIAVG